MKTGYLHRRNCLNLLYRVPDAKKYAYDRLRNGRKILHDQWHGPAGPLEKRRKGESLDDLELVPPGDGFLLVQFGGDSQQESALKAADPIKRLGRMHRAPSFPVFTATDLLAASHEGPRGERNAGERCTMLCRLAAIPEMRLTN